MADNNTELRSDIQHGLDDNPHNDAEKAAALGGLGGAAVGAAAGSIVGPVGTVVGAIAGGLLGAGASGLAVGTVDQFDNDNTVSGIGDGTTSADVDPLIAAPDYPPASEADTRTASSFAPETYVENEDIRMSQDGPVTGTGVGGHNIVTGEAATSNAGNTGLAAGAVIGGLAGAAAGGPLGAVIGGTMGSLIGGVTGDAVEAADDEADLGDDGTFPYSATTDDWAANRTAMQDINAANAIPLGESTVGAARSGDPEWNFGASDFDEETRDLSSTQTDYRAVDEGLASLGATDTNSDEAFFSDLNGGVRSDDYDAEAESTRTGTDFDSWSLEHQNSTAVNDAPGIHPENMTTAGALVNQDQMSTDQLSGDDRDKKRSGNFSNDGRYHTDLDIGTSTGG